MLGSREQGAGSVLGSRKQGVGSRSPLPTPHSPLPTSSKGQSLVEYSVLLAIVVAAWMAMHIYLKRGIAGGLRGSADSIGEPYAPTHMASSNQDLVIRNQSTTKSYVVKDYAIDPHDSEKRGDVMITTTTVDRDETTRSGHETTEALKDESLWEKD